MQRPPDSVGVASYVRELAMCHLTLSEVVRLLKASDEYQATAGQVCACVCVRVYVCVCVSV